VHWRGPLIEFDRFDHIAIAVRDLGRACELYGDAFGGVLVRGGDDLELGIRTMQFKLPPGVKVELLTPIGESYLARYLDKHGEGFHHATVFVADLHAAIAELEERGFEIVDLDDTMPTWQEAFVRPSSGFGALLQLVTSVLDWGEPIDGLTRDAVLAGEWRWINNRCVRTEDVERDGLVSVRPPKNFVQR
jgi:methylmalonyl-CoA/ethylmalonyl-CoA epimerase